MNNQVENWLPVLSLLIAALAVFFGPLISWLIAKHQMDNSIRVANKQVIAPMRQAWINNLRDLVADLLGKCAHYWAAGFDEREDSEYRHITELLYKLDLFLNPNEEDHVALIQNLRVMHLALSEGRDPEHDNVFWDTHRTAVALVQRILKREWDRVKSEI